MLLTRISILLAASAAAVSSAWATPGPEVNINQHVALKGREYGLEPPGPCNLTANPATKMKITSTWQNVSEQMLTEVRSQTIIPVMGSVYPQTFPNGNVLEKPDPKATGLGGTDRIVGPQEYFRISYTIKLASCNSFQFWVDLYGRTELSVREFDVHVQLWRNPLALSDTDKTMYRDSIYAFADGVREQSNGAHRIRTVTFHGKEYQRLADVQWVQECRNNTAIVGPSATPNGRDDPGRYIHFCDTWSGWNSPVSAQTRGYTLAHEWGHFFYGLLDEYCHGSCVAAKPGGPEPFPLWNDTPVDPSIMNRQYNALGGQRQWLNFSSARIYSLMPAVRTAQKRVFDVAGWPTLLRPPAEDPDLSAQPAYAAIKGWPKRQPYPELAGFGPEADSATSTEKSQGYRLESGIISRDPDCGSTISLSTRCKPQVLFTGRTFVSMLIIDRSQSMAKAAAKAFLDELPLGEWKLGVMSFDGTATLVQPILPMNTDDDLKKLKEKIDSILPGNGNRAVSSAAQLALQYMAAADPSKQATGRIAYLITGGGDTTGKNPALQGKEYRNSNAWLAVADLGTSADPGLQELALQINRQSLRRADSASSLLRVMNLATDSFGPIKTLRNRPKVPLPTPAVATKFRAINALTGLVVMTHYKSAQGVLSFKLKSPDAAERSPSWCVLMGDEVVCLFKVNRSPYLQNDPAFVGDWDVRLQTAVASPDWGYSAFGIDDSQNLYLTEIRSNSGRIASYPEQMIIEASLAQDLPVAKATVSAQVTRPDNSVAPLLLRDDGIAPDGLANDGIYTGVLDYTTNGSHVIQVEFNNSGGTAELTDIGLAGKDQTTVIPTAEQFDSVGIAEFVIQGVRPDDHGNNILAATTLPINWMMLPGRLEASSDVDFFRAQALGSGTFNFVLRDIGGGMTPRVRLLAADGSTVLVNATMATHGTPDGRLRITLPLALDQVVYVEVTDAVGAAGGYYKIAMGSAL